MAEINLLDKLPKGKRNLNARATAKTDDHIQNIAANMANSTSTVLGEYGYGGYRYDGRWVPVAQDMIRHFDLKPGDRVLDVGCAKGFLVKDFMKALPGLEAFGLDVSHYAMMKCEPEVIGQLHLGSGDSLPFPGQQLQGCEFPSILFTISTVQGACGRLRRCSGFRAGGPSCRSGNSCCAHLSTRRSSKTGC